ncbi:hypothetical protein EXS57_02415 [Candidatus Kaiserbacteria bacterium]|nr:hypothetical protein [Candidatus Kaiserbacteria bacterium]
MEYLTSPLGQIIVITTFFLLVVAMLVHLYLRSLARDDYRRGYATGKRIVRTFKEDLQRQFGSFQGNLEERLINIQGQVFNAGFGKEVGGATDHIKGLDARYVSIETEIGSVSKVVEEQFAQRRSGLEKEIQNLEGDLEKERSLLKDARTHAISEHSATATEASRSMVRGQSMLSDLTPKFQELLREAGRRLEKDLLAYGYALIAASLALGDAYIAFRLLNDFFSVSDNPMLGYVGGALIALVAFVFFEFLLHQIDEESARNQRRADSMMRYALGAAGVMVLIAVTLMIIAPAMENKATKVFDAMFRVLLLPLAFLLALIVRKIRKDEGDFSFLLTPFKVVILPILLLLVRLLIVLEAIISYIKSILVSWFKAGRPTSTGEQTHIKNTAELEGRIVISKAELRDTGALSERKKESMRQELQSERSRIDDERKKIAHKIQVLRNGCNQAVVKFFRVQTAIFSESRR